MKGPERRTGHTNTDVITEVKAGTELTRDFPNQIAIIRYRRRAEGQRRADNMWYPLNTPQELMLKAGNKVRVSFKTEKVGLGSRTTATIQLLN